LSTLTGYKYRIVESGSSEKLPYGYDFLDEVGNMEIYKNRYALPFAFAYDKYIKKSDFMALKQREKQVCLLACAVLEDDARTKLEPISEAELQTLLNSVLKSSVFRKNNMTWFEELTTELSREPFVISEWKQDHIKGTIEVNGNRMLYFSIADVDGWTVWVDGRSVTPQSVNLGFFGVPLREGEHTIELQFRSRMFVPGLVVTLITVLLYIFAVIFRKRLTWLRIDEMNDANPPPIKETQAGKP
jgi:uncharacterized membrane protein YfhO